MTRHDGLLLADRVPQAAACLASTDLRAKRSAFALRAPSRMACSHGAPGDDTIAGVTAAISPLKSTQQRWVSALRSCAPPRGTRCGDVCAGAGINRAPAGRGERERRGGGSIVWKYRSFADGSYEPNSTSGVLIE